MPWIWKLVAIVLPVALGAALVAAAVSGTRSAHTGPGFGGASFGGAPLGGAAGGGTGSSGGRGGFTVPGWLPWTLLAIVGLALAAAVVVLWLRRERTATEQPETRAARAAVQAAIGALDEEADPRRAVIAA